MNVKTPQPREPFLIYTLNTVTQQQQPGLISPRPHQPFLSSSHELNHYSY